MSEMDYRYLGASALKVSPLCLGAMMFGGEAEAGVGERIIAKAGDAGINFIDTADAYHAGKSEEIVGKAVAGNRDYWVLATKFGYGSGFGPNARGQSRKWVLQAFENSLRRMGTDYLDILYFHQAALDQPLEEPLRAIGELISQGKLLYYGVSNFKGWRIAEICRLADQLNMPRPVVSQPLYNIVDRLCEVEQLPASAHYGLGVVPYSPLARGVLSGKYAPGAQPPEGSRAARGDVRIMQTEWRPESIVVAEAVGKRAEELGMSTIDYAICWILRNKLVSAAIAGPRTEEQWDTYMGALAHVGKLTEEDEALINGLVKPGHPSTPGHTDPAYPIEGRKV